MKAFTAKDDKTIRRTVVLFPTFQIFLVPLFIIGFAGVMFASAPGRPDQILPHILMNTQLPSWLVGLFCAGALAASMSSGDAMVHAAASIVVRDGWCRAAGRELTPRRERTVIRWVVVAVMLVSYVTAMIAYAYEVSLVMLLLSAYGAVVQFAPVVVATLYFKRMTGRAVLGGLLAGAAVTTLFVLWPNLQPVKLHAGLYGLCANVALMALGSRRAKPDDETTRFLAVAAGEAGTD
jgi:SSS family solute:Na+ symporter